MAEDAQNFAMSAALLIGATMPVALRIAAILLLQPQLDANYEAVKSATSQWPASDKNL